jgi:hypothetical protein
MSAIQTRSSRANAFVKARLTWWVGVLAVIGGGLWLSAQIKGRSIDEREEPGILVHLESKLGDKAPSFTLSDSEGMPHSVTPGGGTPTILVFHMGTR